MNYLGIDCGSSACKAVIINSKKDLLFKSCLPVQGNTLLTVKNVISEIPNTIGNDFKIGVTGSSRVLLSKYLKTTIVKSELIAHTIGALDISPDVKTIIEIGGQDSKLITIENGLIKDFSINSVCAAGTGTFIESQAHKLGILLDEFDDIAKNSNTILPLMGKCSVFIESAIINQQKLGAKKEDIAYSLCVSMAKNYSNELIKGRDLKQPVYMQGGVARISTIVKALSDEIGKEITVMPNCEYLGAYGVAICAQQATVDEITCLQNTGIEKEITTMNVFCTNCVNNCTLIDYYFDKKFEFRIGGRCGKYN